jgi:uncharacterized protein
MNAYDFVHLTFLAMKNHEIKGNTKLQKTVYFLGLRTGLEEELGYRPHFYGPYSDEVADAVGRLKALGFLDHSHAGVGSVDSRGFEVVRSDYRLNDDGRKVAEIKKKKFEKEWGEIERGAAELETLLTKDYMQLSIAAKIKFMLGERQDRSPVKPNELAAMASRFGWSVTPEQVQSAASWLAEAGLVTLA